MPTILINTALNGLFCWVVYHAMASKNWPLAIALMAYAYLVQIDRVILRLAEIREKL